MLFPCAQYYHSTVYFYGLCHYAARRRPLSVFSTKECNSTQSWVTIISPNAAAQMKPRAQDFVYVRLARVSAQIKNIRNTTNKFRKSDLASGTSVVIGGLICLLTS